MKSANEVVGKERGRRGEKKERRRGMGLVFEPATAISFSFFFFSNPPGQILPTRFFSVTLSAFWANPLSSSDYRVLVLSVFLPLPLCLSFQF